MDRKQIQEIRKTMTKSKCVIDRMTGCFVGEDGTVIAQLKETFLALAEEELEKYCELFRKTLTGKIGKNLFTMEFPLAEEQPGGKQAMMFRMLQSDFQDEELNEEFFSHILEHLDQAGRHLILLAHGVYDVPGRTSDGIDMEDASENVYSFMICCICPVVEVKEGLCYDEATLTFINKKSDLGVQMPELGFLYPAFHDRGADIHSILYYAKKEDERHPELMDGLIGGDLPFTETVQKELFTGLMEQALGRDCDFENVKNLTDSLNELVKQSEDSEEPLELGKVQMQRLLRDAGADSDAIDKFDEIYDEEVKEGQTFRAENIAGRTVMELKSPSVKISVKSEMAAMLTTRVIDGREYILIPVQDDIELNGIRLLTTRVNTKDAPNPGADVPSDSLGENYVDESLLHVQI